MRTLPENSNTRETFSIISQHVVCFCVCRNPKFFEINEKYLNDPKNCPVASPPGVRNLLADAHNPPPFDAQDFVSHAATWFAISIIVSLGIAYTFIHLVRNHADGLARGTIAFQISIPIVAAISLLLSGAVGQSAIAGVWAGLTWLVFYLWRREIGIAARLLSVAGHGLAANPSLILYTILLNVAGVFLAFPPFIGAVLGFAVGDVVVNPARDVKHDDDIGGGGSAPVCVDEFGNAVPCCAWQPVPNAMAYMGFAALVGVWTMLTLNQIRVFTVSGTVAQWYFSATSTAAATGNAALRSLKYACTSSFGTNAFAGLILTFTNAVKSQQQQEQNNGQVSLFGFLASCLASLFEYLTKFATVMAAITGDSLLTAGRKVTDLLVRSALEAFATTVWFPSAVLTLATFTVSTLFGGLVWLSYHFVHHPTSGEKYPATNAIVLAVLVGVVTLFVLSFMTGVLLSCLDAVFVCFAIDRDRQEVGQQEIYDELKAAVVERGILVESPDGELGYGASSMTR